MIDLKSLYKEEVQEYAVSIGDKKYRGTQIFEWMYKGVWDIDAMSNIPKALKEKIRESAFVETLTIEKMQCSQKDGTRKYLMKLHDDNFIETVLMKHKYGTSICISSQVGCKMGCIFCASGADGLKRNLTAAEMIDQILRVQQDIGETISRVVVMGTGEPLDNYENLIRFIRIANDEDGLNIGLRHITVSTCGILNKLPLFTKDIPQVNLAVSLHAPNDEIRNKIMPVSTAYGFVELINACKTYTQATKRRITFEYVLMDGINDDENCAKELGRQLKGMLCHVNLIPLNQVREKEYMASGRMKADRFKEVLEKVGIEVTIRRELGSDIDAACGQLRNRK